MNGEFLIDLAGIAALLGFLGTAAQKIWTAWRNSDGKREALLSAREQKHDAQIDAKLERLEIQLEIMERTNKALIGTLTVLVDQFILDEQSGAALTLIALNLRLAFPDRAEMPPDMDILLRRIDARGQTAKD